MQASTQIVHVPARSPWYSQLWAAVTSDRAIRAYKLAWAITRHTVLLTMAAAYFSGVLARHGWNWLMDWADDFVSSCQAPKVEPILAPAPAIAGLLPPAPESPAPSRILITPPILPPTFSIPPSLPTAPAEIAPTAAEPAPKRKRRQTKKAVA